MSSQRRFTNAYMVHCVGGCCRGMWREGLDDQNLQDVTCSHCGSSEIAVWWDKECVFAYNGRVDYPMGDTPFGMRVPGRFVE